MALRLAALGVGERRPARFGSAEENLAHCSPSSSASGSPRPAGAELLTATLLKDNAASVQLWDLTFVTVPSLDLQQIPE